VLEWLEIEAIEVAVRIGELRHQAWVRDRRRGGWKSGIGPNRPTYMVWVGRSAFKAPPSSPSMRLRV
jgi:hypothetical protein